VIIFKITAWDTNCPQHIPQKFDAADVGAAIAARDQRIAELEAEAAVLKGEKAGGGASLESKCVVVGEASPCGRGWFRCEASKPGEGHLSSRMACEWRDTP